MKIQSDILIIGSGIAGLSLALKLADRFKVSIITKKEAMDANTRYAQGGIASVMSATDNFDSHIQDTLKAGDGLCHEDVVEKIVKDGPRFIDELIEIGVSFSRRKGKEYDLGREGGHSQRRVLHSGDMTGNEIESAALKKVRKNPNIKIHEYHVAIDLILSKKIDPNVDENCCLGVYVLDTEKNIVRTFEAPVTILATGGAGRVYLYTSNPDIATGDGLAMAYRAGAKIANLEFVQFHPTCLYDLSFRAEHPGERKKSFLISEAVRGEGGILKLIDGTPFMPQYHPMKDLASRDIVARAIDFEMKKRGDDYVLLDISHKGKKFIKERFPNIYATCKKAGYNMSKEPVPVVPAAHYFCGGVVCDMEGRTSLPSLYAIGEVACTGLHGANRLASNSLLEAVAMADYSTQSIIRDFSKFKSRDARSRVSTKIPEWNPGKATESEEAVVVNQNWGAIRHLLWNYVGIVRSNKRLERAKQGIQTLQKEIKDYYWNFTITRDLIELRNIAMVAEMIIDCAMVRKESRGLHYNIDYPEKKEEERKDTVIEKPD